jgi:homoserine kinase
MSESVKITPLKGPLFLSTKITPLKGPLFLSTKIKVPATTANLGPGFDILGAALNLYNFIELNPSSENKIIITGSEADNEIPVGNDNLIYSSVLRVFQELGIAVPPLELKVEINIPLSRGLGSSSSAIVGGLVAANLFCGNQLSNERLLNIANEIEGHPDNVAPCLLGGLISSLCDNGKVYTQKIITGIDLSFVVLVPDFKLSTEKARQILPATVPFKDAVFNSSRLCFLINGFVFNNTEMLKVSLNDRLHEPYRGQLIPGFEEIKKCALDNGAIGSVLSGAGPSILALATENEENIAKAMQSKWQEFGIKSDYKILKPDTEGTREILE